MTTVNNIQTSKQKHINSKCSKNAEGSPIQLCQQGQSCSSMGSRSDVMTEFNIFVF